MVVRFVERIFERFQSETRSINFRNALKDLRLKQVLRLVTTLP